MLSDRACCTECTPSDMRCRRGLLWRLSERLCRLSDSACCSRPSRATTLRTESHEGATAEAGSATRHLGQCGLGPLLHITPSAVCRPLLYVNLCCMASSAASCPLQFLTLSAIPHTLCCASHSLLYLKLSAVSQTLCCMSSPAAPCALLYLTLLAAHPLLYLALRGQCYISHSQLSSAVSYTICCAPVCEAVRQSMCLVAQVQPLHVCCQLMPQPI